METEPGKLPSPPGLIASLSAGFDAVANHITVIALPVLLDLFLWLGPHLRLKQLFQPLIDSLPGLAAALPSGLPDTSAIQKVWIQFIDEFNLFILLRTLPIGASSLMSGRMPTENPYGTAINFDAGSFPNVAGWWLLIIVTGWIIGGLYYHWVSGVALKLEQRSLSRALVQSLLLSAIWLGILFIFGLPAFVVFAAISAAIPLLGQVILFIFALFSLWLALPIFFSPHGIFTNQQDALRTMLGSLRLVRFTLPSSGIFLLSFILISQGLDFLWRTPPQNSWWSLVGIAGHAFISTVLLAASFIYYRDMSSWLTLVFEKLKTQPKPTQV